MKEVIEVAERKGCGKNSSISTLQSQFSPLLNFSSGNDSSGVGYARRVNNAKWASA